jgi:hypothetical protein
VPSAFGVHPQVVVYVTPHAADVVETEHRPWVATSHASPGVTALGHTFAQLSPGHFQLPPVQVHGSGAEPHPACVDAQLSPDRPHDAPWETLSGAGQPPPMPSVRPPHASAARRGMVDARAEARRRMVLPHRNERASSSVANSLGKRASAPVP